MVVHPCPDTAWLHYQPRAEVVAEKSQKIFQRVLSDEEYVNLVGARTGEVVIVSPRTEPIAGLAIPMIFINHSRCIRINGIFGRVLVIYSLAKIDNGPQLTLQNFLVPPVAQGKGLATRMFDAQVAAGRTFGFDQIVAHAAGGNLDQAHKKHHPLVQHLLDNGVEIREEQDNRNGYYTWPRLSFDKRLTLEDITRLPRQFAHLTFLSDLTEQSEGRDWWRDHGFALELIFDTSLQSRSMQLLHKAIARLDQKGEYWNSGPETPLHIERGEVGRPRRDWMERIWEYQQH